MTNQKWNGEIVVNCQKKKKINNPQVLKQRVKKQKLNNINNEEPQREK